MYVTDGNDVMVLPDVTVPSVGVVEPLEPLEPPRVKLPLYRAVGVPGLPVAV